MNKLKIIIVSFFALVLPALAGDGGSEIFNKGFFHIPRYLLDCIQVLKRLEGKNTKN